MNEDKDLKLLLSKIEDLNILSQLEESIEMMKNMVIKNKRMSPEDKKKCLFIFNACNI